MSTCPTNPQYQPLSRATTYSCGINNDVKHQTDNEIYAYTINNPQIRTSCVGDPGAGDDDGDSGGDDSGDDSDGGNDPEIIPDGNNIAASNPLFPDITQDIINEAMNLVAKNDFSVGADTGNVSNTIANGGGSVCQYKPIKF